MRTASRPALFRVVLADAEFRVLWLAQALSVIGDQLARVALSVLVYELTGSAALTATAYALSFLPWLVGGPLLAGYADRLPRRAVLIGCDLVRAGILTAMALPGTPVWLLIVLVVAAEMFEPPFSAARAALLPDVFPDDRYVTASALGQVTRETGQLVGFGVGGLLVAAMGARGALLADAATFAASALLVRAGVAARPAAAAAGRSALRHLRSGLRAIFADPALRSLVLLGWLCALYVVPEGLAVPLADAAGGGPVAVGLLLAANPAGSIVGSLALARWVAPERRLELMLPLAVVSVGALVPFAFSPGLPAALGLLVLSGAGSAYNLAANAAFVQAVDPGLRGQAFGVVQSGMYVGQGAALALGGVLAEAMSPATVIGFVGVVGVAVVAALGAGWHR